ncbi:MAG: DUF1446 domain-containing protein [Planctomycetaceae bacterium]|nr:DUF1446 domain-containing protein [Planctomycetaceae bacterium]
MKTTIRVGNAQAFWGDQSSAAANLLSQLPDLDFLTMDYLAEVSMSILAAQREQDAARGFPQDFVDVVSGLAEYWSAGGRCRLIANAGGLNPVGCAEACITALERAGCRSLKIGVVSGDNVLPQLLTSDPRTQSFQNLDTQASLVSIRDKLITANAYLGCRGIVQALQAGADIVITGRVADPSMVVAPCVYAFGWHETEWDRIAGATVAGHLLECGTHVTGGISTDWLEVRDPAHLGFPIAEIHSDGTCVVTKSPLSGGRVTLETVKEQLLYEIGDPDHYLSPDVTVSFLNLQLAEEGADRISVRGAVGRPCPPTLKISATYRDGFRAAGMLTIFGPQSVRKAQRCGEIVLQRLGEAGHQYRDTIVECLGNAGSVPVGMLAADADSSYETILRIAVESDSRAAVEQFTRELMPLVTAGPQGTTGYGEGRPRIHAVVRYWPCLIETGKVAAEMELFSTLDTTATRNLAAAWPSPKIVSMPTDAPQHLVRQVTLDDAVRLADIAYGRSGDKGTSANIGILARSPLNYPWLVDWLTPDRVLKFFEPLGVDSVERFELPNLCGLNFVVRGILQRSLRNDAQGKALAQALLSMPLHKSSR